MLDSYFIAASAVIVFTLGAVHLFYTFVGRKLDPRDDALRARMQEVPLVITRETTMWRAWIGFNASHSIGIILFGWIYGYLALAQADVFFKSPFLIGTGVALLAAYVALSRHYFFSVPFRGVVAATVSVCVAVAMLVAWRATRVRPGEVLRYE